MTPALFLSAVPANLARPHPSNLPDPCVSRGRGWIFCSWPLLFPSQVFSLFPQF